MTVFIDIKRQGGARSEGPFIPLDDQVSDLMRRTSINARGRIAFPLNCVEVVSSGSVLGNVQAAPGQSLEPCSAFPGPAREKSDTDPMILRQKG